MRKRIRKILVTGGAGFIGSAFVRLLSPNKNYRIIVVDKLTYAGDLKRLGSVKKQFSFYRADICDRKKIGQIIKAEKVEIIVNFAAETHVDRSIVDSGPFMETNVKGVQVLLELSRKYKISKFVHISTDEVYGEIVRGSFSENYPLSPNSPYAASKAAADLLINAYIRTYEFPAVIIRPSNNYGPWQYPEKFIPLSMLKILKNERIPVYGKGLNVREWLFVEDCAQGIIKIMNEGKIGNIYNIGSGKEMRNIDIAKKIVKIMNINLSAIQFVKDRPGHDLRYSLNSAKAYKETGWKPRLKFDDALRRTIVWCIDNRKWLVGKWAKIASLYK